MKYFSFISHSILASIIFIPGALLYSDSLDGLFGAGFSELHLLIGFAAVQFLALMWYINHYYQKPIVELEYSIKRFLTGQYQGQAIQGIKSSHPSVNYILEFFIKTLSTLKNIKSEFTHGKAIKGEVEIAREIQGTTFSKKLTTIDELDVIATSKPAGEIGGDSYDAILSDDNYYVYVGDATGHGVGAGFIMMMVNSLVHGFAQVFRSGADILAHTNAIVKPRIKANLLMTVLLIRWDIKQKKLYMTGAGHEYLMIYKKSQGKCFKIRSGGAAIGMVKNIDKLLQEKQIKFEQDDVLVLYSDGITEAINSNKKDGNHQQYGEARLMAAIEATPDVAGQSYKSARGVYNNITIDLSRFMGYQHVQLDDITLAVIHYKGPDHKPQADVSKDIPEDFITEWNWYLESKVKRNF